MDYNNKFLDFQVILDEKEKKHLSNISNNYQLKYLFAERNMNDISIDFAYSNAKLEGCTYTYHEAETLILTGKTANNKPFSDAQMVINLKDAYIFMIKNSKMINITVANIKNIHKLTMKNLLQENELGHIRKIPVRIGGTEYIPTTDNTLLNKSLEQIVNNVSKYENIFEKAIYLHNNLAYLQYFTDGNKRVSRIMQTTTLLSNNLMPLFYLDDNVTDYKNALIKYYEVGSYKDYKDYFIHNYEKSLEKVVKFLKIKIPTPDFER